MADWYCVKGASGGSGTLLDPWGLIANINWGSMASTDTLWLSGDFDEQMAVTIDGADIDNRFTIRGDYSTTEVTIDVGRATDYCISANTDDYIHFLNLTLADAGQTLGIGLRIASSTGCLVENVTSTDCLWTGISIQNCTDTRVLSSTASANLVRGMAVSGTTGACDNVRFEHCAATGNGRRGFTLSGEGTGTNVTNSGFDSCTSSGNGGGYQMGNSDNCYLVNSTSANETLTTLDPLSDEKHWAVEVIESTNLLISKNILTGNSLASIIEIVNDTLPTDNLRIWGNVLKDMTYASGYAIRFNGTNSASPSIAGNVLMRCTRGTRLVNNIGQFVCNNTFIDITECVRAQEAITADNLHVKNNIFQTDSATGNGLIYTVVAAGNSFTIDSNHYFAPSNVDNALVRYNGSLYKAADVTTIDANAIVGDAGFTDAANDDYSLLSTSTAVGSGVKWWTGANPPGSNGEIFTNFDTDRGGVQSTYSDYHAANL